MSKLDNIIDNKVVQNLFIWFCLFLILLITIQAENRVLSSFFTILLLAPPVYINNLVILSFLRKKVLLFLSLFIVNVLLFTGVSVFFITIELKQPFELIMFINFFGVMVLAMLFASAIKIAKDSFARRQHEKEAELKLLKAQLNPHFLFNTLNNLYGLSVIKSDKLPNLMLKLSDLLRYSLYETKETVVPLEKEIQYLENYISLEKIRLEDTTEIAFTKEGALDSVKIAPMLLIVFVENAFKHLHVSKNEMGRVTVSIEVKKHQLFFKCENTFLNNNTMDDNLEKGRSGIGLLNAKKRLNLLYSEKHQLQTKTKNNTYSVSLTLSINA